MFSPAMPMISSVGRRISLRVAKRPRSSWEMKRRITWFSPAPMALFKINFRAGFLSRSQSHGCAMTTLKIDLVGRLTPRKDIRLLPALAALILLGGCVESLDSSVKPATQSAGQVPSPSLADAFVDGLRGPGAPGSTGLPKAAAKPVSGDAATSSATPAPPAKHASEDAAASSHAPDSSTKSASGDSAGKSVGSDPPTGQASGDVAGPSPKTGTKVASLPADHPNAGGYRIGPLDVLTVSVFQVPDLNKDVQVGDEGMITLPLIGMVKAGGQTTQNLERDIAAKLGAKYLQSPQVSVFVKEYNSQTLTVEGAVNSPGIIPIKGSMSLIGAIAQSKGFSYTADENNVVVFRYKGGEKYAARFDVGAIRSGSAEDPPLERGDIVEVDESGAKRILKDVLPVLPVLGLFVTTAGVL